MDLEIAKQRAGKSWAWARIAALVCFALASGLLIGSLLKPQTAKASARTGQLPLLTAKVLQSK